MSMIAQIDVEVKRDELYQLNNEILTLADLALEKANQHRQKWLATGDPQEWRLWHACLQDREALLGEVGDGR